MTSKMRIAASALAVLAIAGIAYWIWGPSSTGGEEQPSVLVTTTKLQTGSLPHLVSAYGTVQADPSARQSIMAPASASVARIYVRLGQEVAKGAQLIELVPNPQTQSDYAQARSALEAANSQLRHTQELFTQYLATNQQLSDAKKAAADARAALHALTLQGGGGPKTLTAQFRAVVTKIDASTGALVSEGSPLLELAPPGSLVLKVGVVPAEASAIKPGDKATVTAVGASRNLTASVLLSGSVVDPSNGLVPVEVSLPANSLFSGQSAEVTIETGSVHGFVVPHDAVLIDSNGNPYVVQAVRDTARLVQVTILDTTGQKDVIAGKLDPKSPLVLSGNYQLQDGMKVRQSKSGADAP